MKRPILSVLCVLFLLSAMTLTVLAHEIPDLDAKGSITVSFAYEGRPVPGGKITVYRVADVARDDGSYFFQLTPEFAELAVSLEDPMNPKVAEEFARFISDKHMSGATFDIDSAGRVALLDMSVGLYFICQNTPAPGYNAIKPFLISVPNNENGQYIYHVDASPKVALETAPTVPTTETTIPQETIPQTGQTNWPVPVMLAAGLLFFLGGWYMRRSGKETAE